MAGLYVLILGFLAASCSGHNGYDHRFDDVARPQQIQQPNQQQSPISRFLSKFGIDTEDQKCFTVAKRPFYTNRLMQYPCYKRQEGVPVVNSFMSPFGQMCVSNFRERVYRHYRIQTCCPGYAMDKLGRCSIRLPQNNNNNKNNIPTFDEQARNMIQMATTNLQQNMWQRNKNSMQQRQDRLLANFQNKRQQFMPQQRHQMMHNNRHHMMHHQRPRMMPPMPPMSPFMNMFNRGREQRQPKVAFLRFGQTPMQQMQTTPPMPSPVVRPPMTRMIKVVRHNLGPMLMTFQGRFPVTRNPFSGNQNRVPQAPQPQQETRQRVMSNRAQTAPFRGMPEFHPRLPQPTAFRMAPPPMYQGRPQMHGQPMNNGHFYNPEAQRVRNDFNRMHANEGFYAPEPQEAQAPIDVQVDLPQEPAQMPDLVVEKAPTNQESCITKLETAEQICLKQSGIDAPDIMTAFEPFNDELSLVLCGSNAVFDCIVNELKTCEDTNEAVFARDMTRETSEMVRSMCEMRRVSVETVPEVVAEEQQALSSTEGKPSETIASVESVDAIPVADKQPEDLTVVAEDKPAVEGDGPTESMSSVQAMQEAIQHEVDVQELRMKEYLLPILIGSGVGFFLIVLIISLMVCCCCKRKMKRKMKMAKEMEKPPLKDEIYTIGLAPPVYEVNGIPPMYYEEAKGEKISSRSSSIQEGSSGAESEATQM